jgi:hypothetical protein
LSDTYLNNLRDLVLRKGLSGCYEYWSQALNEEAADFVMQLDQESGLFRIEMRHCPSKGMLQQTSHIQAYPRYCAHCDRIYRRVLEPLGYTYTIDLTQTEQACCVLTVKTQISHPAQREKAPKSLWERPVKEQESG